MQEAKKLKRLKSNTSNGNKNSKNSLAEKIYEKLLNKFQRNELVPGNILKRREISKEFNVSVAPVLEAIVRLEIEGFIESIPRKGTIVKPIHKRDVVEQLILREAIECQAARLYCGETIRKNYKRLNSLAIKVEKTESDTLEHWKQEIDFHKNLVILSSCNLLVEEFIKITKLGIFYRTNRIIPSVDKLERQSHITLVDKLIENDPDEAERTIREHLRSGKRHLFENITNNKIKVKKG